MIAPAELPGHSSPDLFGLWLSPSEDFAFSGGETTFAAGDLRDDEVASVWQLPLVRGAGGEISGLEHLRALDAQVQSIEQGLVDVETRLEAFLEARAFQKQSGSLNFAAVPGLPLAEFSLAHALAEYEPPGEQASFGLAIPGVDWGALHNAFQTMLERSERQILHLAYVDTMINERLAARTTVRWGGNLTSFFYPELAAEIIEMHRQSLSIALASRVAVLHTVLTVSQLAGKIAVAVSTPIGAVQALALGWQFVSQVVMPLVKQQQATRQAVPGV